MKPSEFFTIAAMIYLGPHMHPLAGIVMGVIFLILAALMMAIKK